MFIKGTIKDPIISQIIFINVENEAQLDVIRKEIVNGNSETSREIVSNIYKNEMPFTTYEASDFANYSEIKNEIASLYGNARSNQGLQDRTGSNQSSRRTLSSKVKQSLNEPDLAEIEAEAERKAEETERIRKVSDSSFESLLMIKGLNPTAKQQERLDVFLKTERYLAMYMRYANPIYHEVQNASPGDIDYNVRAKPELAELNGTKATTVYVECEFHDNEEYAKWIVDKTKALGEAICRGVCEADGKEYIGLEKPVGTKFYRVQVGAFIDYNNAVNMRNELESMGYPTVIVEVKR